MGHQQPVVIEPVSIVEHTLDTPTNPHLINVKFPRTDRFETINQHRNEGSRHGWRTSSCWIQRTVTLDEASFQRWSRNLFSDQTWLQKSGYAQSRESRWSNVNLDTLSDDELQAYYASSYLCVIAVTDSHTTVYVNTGGQTFAEAVGFIA